MSTLAHLNVKIGADIRAFQTSMGKVQAQLAKVGTSLKSVGSSMSVAVTAPLIGVGAAAIKAASDVEEMQAKFNTVFKNVGGDVKREINEFANAVGRSRFELQGMTAQLGDIFKPLGFTEERAGELSVQMTKLAVDLGSFNNMPMDEALRRLQGTLVGSHENALKFGVVINQNVLNQELARMGADKLTGAQREQAKVQARLNLLMAGTTDAQGDALRTSGSFANQMKRLQNNMKDTGAVIGQILLPYALELVKRFNEAVTFVRDLNPQMQKLGLLAAGVAASVGPLTFIMGNLFSSFSSIAGVLVRTMGLFNPYVAGIAAIASVGVLLYRRWEPMPGLFEDIKTRVADAFTPLLSWWDDNKETVLKRVGEIWTSFVTAVDLGVQAVRDVTVPLLAGLYDLWIEHGATIVNILGAAFNTMLKVVSTYFNNMATLIRLGKAIVKPGWEDVWTELQNLVESNVDLASTAVTDFYTAVTDDADTAGTTPIDKRIDIAGAKRRIVDALGAMTSGFDEFVNDTGTGSSDIQSDVKDIATEFEKIDPRIDNSIKAISAYLTGDTDSLQTNAADAKASVKELFDTIPETLEMPDWDVPAPTQEEIGLWGQWVVKLGDASTEMDGVHSAASQVRWNLQEIKGALGTLFGSKLGGWADDLVQAAGNVASVASGLSAVLDLMKYETWKPIIEMLGSFLGVIKKIVIKIGEWITAQLGLNAAQGATTMVSAGQGLSVPVGNAGGAGAGAGLAGLGGVATVGLGLAGIGLFGAGMNWLGGFTGSTLASNGFDPTTYAGGNLAGAFSGGLGVGTTGLNFGSGWLQGNGVAGSGSSGRMGGTQTINVVLDGRTLATATVPHMAGELELIGTNY